MKQMKNNIRLNGMEAFMACLMLCMSLPILTSCSEDDPMEEIIPEQPTDHPDGDEPGEGAGSEDEPRPSNHIVVRIGSQTFTATLTGNDTSDAFLSLLPVTMTMNEHNGNEKYHYLSSNLPVAASRPGTIQAGDLMLYGSNCVVLFYETFTSSYSYTRIGRIDNPNGLASVVGAGSVSVTFELQQE